VIESRISRTGDRSLMPPYLTMDRKPSNVLWDIVCGLVVTTWSLWMSALLRQFFYVGYDEAAVVQQLRAATGAI